MITVPMLVGWLVGRYLTPKVKIFFDKNPEAEAVAQSVYLALDTIIENIKETHPENKWIEIADKAIDAFAKKIGLDPLNTITEKDVKKMAGERKKFLGII